MKKRTVLAGAALGLGCGMFLVMAQTVDSKKKSKRAPRPGVSTPGVRREMTSIQPQAVFELGGAPDWQVVTDDAVWVANGPKNAIDRLDVKTNTVAATVTVGEKPCSGLAAGFGSIWVPNCGSQTVSRVKIAGNTVEATVRAGPSESEGGITTSPDAVWLVTNQSGRLSRIDPKTNQVAAEIVIPANSAAVFYAEGGVWVTTPEKNMLTRVDAKTNKITHSIEVGPGPRFLTYGAGAIWTLNQGDGTVSRVDAKTGRVLASVEVGVPGSGGEIAFGGGHVWVTVFQIPLSEIDPETNKVVRQWFGNGGDSVRVAHGSIFLSNLRDHNVWRIDPAKLQTQ